MSGFLEYLINYVLLVRFLLRTADFGLQTFLEPSCIVQHHDDGKERGSKKGYFSGFVDSGKRFHILVFKCFLIGTCQMLK